MGPHTLDLTLLSVPDRTSHRAHTRITRLRNRVIGHDDRTVVMRDHQLKKSAFERFPVKLRERIDRRASTDNRRA